MLSHLRIVGLVLLGSAVLGGTALAVPGSVEGRVLDNKGKPLAGAEIRIQEAKAQGKSLAALKTDANGHYVCNSLTAGTVYRVSLVLNGSVKGAVNNVQPKIGSSTKLNFDLSKTSGLKAPTGKHMVWMPADTGSHIGGRWVAVDDKSPTAEPGADNVQKAGNDQIRALQQGVR